MEKEIPKIDLPEDWIIGSLSDQDIGLLNLYMNYPCRLKAEVFVLCIEGVIEASVDLNRVQVKAFDFITILPGSILQIHEVKGDFKIYFMGFSSDFLNNANVGKGSVDLFYAIKSRPLISLKEKGAELLTDYFLLLIKTYGFSAGKLGREITAHLLAGVHLAIGAMYKDKTYAKAINSKSEQICKEFGQLVMQNYNKERNVSWYANKLNITHAHLCTTVKQVSGKTCLEIISEMVILDAKSQLKSTDLSVHNIAYSLNFTNMSFFGKFFKRHVGMGPQEYRNS